MKKALKISVITAGAIVLLLLLLALTPTLFKKKLGEVVKSTINKELKTELNYSDLDISVFRHFPNLTITLSDASLKSSPPFSKDTLVSAREISFAVNLASLFKGPIRIGKVFVVRGRVIVQYNEKGAPNFDVLRSGTSGAEEPQVQDTSGSASIRIEQIVFIKTDFIYSDPSIPLRAVAHGINYKGTSDLSENILRLGSRVQIDSLDVYYDNVRWLKSKPVKANLVTRVNLNSLEMKFEKNDLRINDLPFEFRGEFSFRKEGYSLFLSLFAMFGEEYCSGSVYVVSTKDTWVSAKADVRMTLQNWSKAFGLKDVDLKGMLDIRLKSQGEYAYGQNPDSRTPDTILLSVPELHLTSKLTDGYFHYKALPQSLSGISFDLAIDLNSHDYRDVTLKLEHLRAGFHKNTLEGYLRVNGLRDLPVEGHLATSIDLSQLKDVVPLDSLDLKGQMNITADVKGNYAPDKKSFPASTVILDLKNGFLQTKYYPQPVEHITAHAKITNSTGTVAGTQISLQPVSFTFAGNPFELNASLSNPENLQYDITAKGTLDLAKLYHLFSMEGMDLAGFIQMDLRLKGRQSDAMAGNYDKLKNFGRLELHDIAFTSSYLPLPFVVTTGVFRFENDNLWFEQFKARYGASDITMDGHLSNTVNFLLSPNQPLKGSFRLRSQYLLADEFMAPGEQPAGGGGQLATDSTTAAAEVPEGVIVIPANLEMSLNADAGKVRFRGIDIHDLSGTVEAQKGVLLLKDTRFNLIGCHVALDATYGSYDPHRAYFDFHIKADSFDIKRAYNEVEMVRNLLSSAGKCEGIVSLDYSLKGILSDGMDPVYPSLEGGGTLTLEKVQVRGLKLFSAMSKNLEKDQLKDPDLSKVELKTHIKDNVITLEKTRIKIAGFRFRVSGETTFNGKLNLKSRLGLPPLGIIGIPMRVLGTDESPKFKYGRGNGDEEVDTVQYSDQIPADMLEKIKSAKSEDLEDKPK